jgi:biopolymer transport protein TolQ
VGRRIEQRLVLVLAVELDEASREISERASGRERAVDEGAAPALGGDLASDEQFFPAAFENRFDDRRILAGPDQVSGRAPAEEQPDRFHENRLAGSCFASQDIQPGVEFDLNRIEDGEVGDAEEAEHLKKRGKFNPNIGLTDISQSDTVSHYQSGGTCTLVALSQRRISYVAEDRLRTLGGLFPALLLQAQGGVVLESSTGLIGRIAQASILSKSVLLVLILLSTWSWGIFLFKWWTFRQAARHTSQFLDVFRRSNKFSEVQAVCRSLGHSPLVGLFQSGYAELTAQLRQQAPADALANPKPAPGRPTIKSLSSIDRALLRASAVEVNKLENHVTFLATTASMAPFVGLFGTVWGIMSSFDSIGQAGSTSLAVVGPGIADALVATAMGLAAAIPAVWFYNALSRRVKLFASEMDDFSMEFLNIAERNFT